MRDNKYLICVNRFAERCAPVLVRSMLSRCLLRKQNGAQSRQCFVFYHHPCLAPSHAARIPLVRQLPSHLRASCPSANCPNRPFSATIRTDSKGSAELRKPPDRSRQLCPKLIDGLFEMTVRSK